MGALVGIGPVESTLSSLTDYLWNQGDTSDSSVVGISVYGVPANENFVNGSCLISDLTMTTLAGEIESGDNQESDEIDDPDIDEKEGSGFVEEEAMMSGEESE